MSPTLTILEAMADGEVFASLFKDPRTWRTWRVVLAAMFGLPMERGDRAIFQKLTGRSKPPREQVQEAWWIKGRRAGGSFIAALIAVYLAAFRDYTSHLAPGEQATLMILASDRKQARTIMRYVMGILSGVPMLSARIERETAEGVDLAGRVTVEVHTSNFRAVRGYSVVAVILDEVAFYRDEASANPDREILEALRPAMATIPGALLVGLSTPYRRAGVLWDAFRRHYGHDGDPVLVIRGDTRTLNPTIPQRVVDEAIKADPQAAAAEWGAEFRSDLESLFDDELLDDLVDEGVHERPPAADASYVAFADPSGGRGDAFTLGIAHLEGDQAILDLCRGRRAPFDPSAVVAEYAALLKEYGCPEVQGDRYAGEWVTEAFEQHGVAYRAASLTKSEIYLEGLPLFTRGAVRLLDVRSLLVELVQLERRTTRSGKDSVDHPPRGHDDLANVAVGALALAAGERVEDLGDAWVGPRLKAADADWGTIGGLSPWDDR